MNNIFLLGDSTCADKTPEVYPETGWGTCFSKYVNNNYKVINLAQNGMSSRRFIEGGLFDSFIKQLKENDWVIIQFGHNESKEDDRKTEPWTTFSDNLRFMIKQIEGKKANPALVSSIERRRHPVENTHGEYPQAMEAVAKEENIPFADMTNPTRELYNKLGPEETKKIFNHKTKEDNSHFSPYGADLMAKMVAERLSTLPIIKNN